MNWNEMTPRQKDALVAEQLFSYAVDWEFDEPCAKELRDQYDEWGILPFYTADMTAAWEVAEHMKEFIWAIALSSMKDKHFHLDRYFCQFTDIEDTVDAEAETAPEAICLAALRAKGVDV